MPLSPPPSRSSLLLAALLFGLALRTVQSNSRFVSQIAIQRGVAACCPGPWAECCRHRLLRDQHILCPHLGGPEQALAIGICLERHFHGGHSVMAERSQECCWLLAGAACRHRCYTDLRMPTMPPDQKFVFTNYCPNSLNASVDPGQLDCVLNRSEVLHSCFSTCLHYMNGTEAQRQAQPRFRPAQHCDAYARLMASDSCLVPLHLFRMAAEMDINTTAETQQTSEEDGDDGTAEHRRRRMG